MARFSKFFTRIRGTGALGIAIIVMGVFLSVATEGFFSSYNLINILRQISLTCFMAIGFSVTLLSGGMDISMGSIAALTGVVVAWLVAVLQVDIFT